MKKQLHRIIAFLIIITIVLACKGDKKNKTTATEAQPAAVANPIATKYKAVIANSTINWTGSKSIEKHTGTISLESGIIKTIDSKIVSGSFLINMKSITVTDLEGKEKENLEEHLKGISEGKEDHFFNVVKFPTAAFEITRINENVGKVSIQGNLTIRGIKKNINFHATTAVTSNTITITSDPFSINRVDWGINYGSKSVFDDLGDRFIDDVITLEFLLVAHKI